MVGAPILLESFNLCIKLLTHLPEHKLVGMAVNCLKRQCRSILLMHVAQRLVNDVPCLLETFLISRGGKSLQQLLLVASPNKQRKRKK